MKNDKIKSNNIVRFGTCTKDCYGSCVFQGEWDDSALEHKLISTEALIDHPFTNGFFCSKLNNRINVLYHKNRLKIPLIRKGGKGNNQNFHAIDLKPALKKISQKLKSVRDTYGPSSIVCASYSGNMGLISQYAPLRLFGEIGATITSGGICNEGGCAGLTELFGTYSTTNPFQIENPNAELIVIWGSDLSDHNIHMYNLVKKSIKRGAKLIVIDNRETKIAKEADLFIQSFPGSDHMVAAVIVHRIFERKLEDDIFLKDYCDNIHSLRADYLQINDNSFLSNAGVKSDDIDKFIDILSKFKGKTIFNIGYGVQKDFYGGRIVKAIALIQIILGNFGKPGTGLIYSQSDFNKSYLKPLINYIGQILPEKPFDEISIIKLGSELLKSKYKMLFVYNFNPASSLPHQNQLREALSRDDLYVVVHDLFLNDTTKYADMVIPAKFDLETNDIITPYFIPGVSINQAGPCPYENCLSNLEFSQQLANQLGLKKDQKFEETDEEILENCLKLLPSKMREHILKKGYHIYLYPDFIPYSDLHFPTKNGRINLMGPHFQFGFDEYESKINRSKDEFMLITPSHIDFLHSQWGQIGFGRDDSFNKVYLNPKDIDSLNLKIGQTVIVSNQYGSAKYILENLQELKKGTALIYSGASSTVFGNPNANLFTPDRPEELAKSGSYNSAIVKISRDNV